MVTPFLSCLDQTLQRYFASSLSHTTYNPSANYDSSPFKACPESNHCHWCFLDPSHPHLLPLWLQEPPNWSPFSSPFPPPQSILNHLKIFSMIPHFIQSKSFTVVKNSATQSVGPWTAAPEATGNLSEMQNLRAYPHQVDTTLPLHKFPGDFYAFESLISTGPPDPMWSELLLFFGLFSYPSTHPPQSH